MTETRIDAAKHAAVRRLALFGALVLVALAALTGSAEAAFNVTGYTLTQSTAQAGAHPSLTIKSTLNASSLDQTGDDLTAAEYDLHPGTKLNPRSVITPCTTAQHASDACPAATKIGQITQKWRLGGISSGSASGDIYALPSTSNSVMGLGFVLRPSSYSKLYFTGRIEEMAGNQTIVVTSIPRMVRSGSIQFPITTSELQLVFNPRSGSTQSGAFLVHGSTSCTAGTTYSMLTAMTGEFKLLNASLTQTGCSQLQTGADVQLERSTTRSGQATGLKTTVYADTTDKTPQNSHLKEILVDLPSGSSINASNLNAPELCPDLAMQLDVCPVGARIGTASIAVPFLFAPLTGEIVLISRGSVAQIGVILRGPSSTRAIVRGNFQVSGGKAQLRFTQLPQVPVSIATFDITSPLVNNPTTCGTSTVWHDVSGWSGARSLIGDFYDVTDCLQPPNTAIFTGPANGSLIRSRAPSFGFAAAPEEGATFECRVDAMPFAPCTSVHTVTPLTDGQHVFQVRAVNAAGSDASPASRTFTVDATPPTAAIVSPTAGEVIAGDSVQLEFTAEAESITTCIFRGDMTTPCTSPKVYEDVEPGNYSIAISVKDAAGNVRFLSRQITVEPSGPSVEIVAPAHGTTSVANQFPIQFNATNADGSPISNVRCILWYVYYPAGGYEYEDYSIANCRSGMTINVDTDSTYRLEVIATSSDGSEAVGSSTFVGGPRLPFAVSSTEDTPKGQIINDRTPTIKLEYSDSLYPNATFECSLVTEGSEPDWQPCGDSSNLPPYQVTDPLPDGSYVLYSRTKAGGLTSNRAATSFEVKDWSVEYTTSTSTQLAGAHPDLNTKISITGGGQFRKIDMRLPKGLIGSLNSFPTCRLSDVETRSCPTATQVGGAIAEIKINGMSGVLKEMPGPAFFTEPYAPGDVAGLFVLIPSPVGGFDDVPIKLRVQLIDNGQQMRVFSDELPIEVLQIFSGDWIDFWVSTFELNINGSQGSPYPFLTNPSRCAPGEFSTVFGDADTTFTPAQSIPYQAIGCEQLAFAPQILQDYFQPSPADGSTHTPTSPSLQSVGSNLYTNDSLDGARLGVAGASATFSLPAGSSGIKSLTVYEPVAVGPNYPAFGAAADKCPGGSASLTQRFLENSDPAQNVCPDIAKVGIMTITTPLIEQPLIGDVYLINKTPLPWFGVNIGPSVAPSNPDGIVAHLTGRTVLEPLPGCDDSIGLWCGNRIGITFDDLPDLPITGVEFDVSGNTVRPARGTKRLDTLLLTTLDEGDPDCRARDVSRAFAEPFSGGPVVIRDQTVAVAPC